MEVDIDSPTYIDDERLQELIRSVAELSEVDDILDDEIVRQTLGHIIKLMNDPNVPVQVAAPLIVQLTAVSITYNLKAKVYQFKKGDREAANKKNLYYSLSEGAEKLAAALKYIV